jgi:hypothetical protein
MDKTEIEYLFNERAGILEFEANLTRTEAEKQAKIDFYVTYGIDYDNILKKEVK